MDAGNVIALLVGAGGLLTAAATAAVSFLRGRAETKRDDARQVNDQQSALIDRLETHVSDLTTQVNDVTNSFLKMHTRHARCRIDGEQTRGLLERSHDLNVRLAALHNAGRPEAEWVRVPDLPPRPPDDEDSDPEYMVRTVQQRSKLLSASASGVHNHQPGPVP